MGLFDTLLAPVKTVGTAFGFADNDPNNGAFDPNDPKFQADPTGQYRQSLMDAIAQAQGRAPTQLNTTQSDQSRAQLLDALVGLRSQANGTAPSVAQNELVQNTNRGVAQLAGTLATNRGIGAGTNARIIANQGADAMQNANNQTSLLRAQEMSTAQNSLVNALSGLRSQDITQATANGQLGLQSQSLADELQKYYQGLYQQILTGNQGAALNLAGDNTQFSIGQNKNATDILKGAMSGLSSSGMQSSMGGGGGAGAAAAM